MPPNIDSGAWRVLGRAGLKWCNSADRCIADANEQRTLNKANHAHEHDA
jgi:hypothetical protein